MNYLLLNFIIALWIEAFVALFLAILLFIKGKEENNRFFGLFLLSMFSWIFPQIWLIGCDNHSTALFWARMEVIGVFFLPTFFLHFTLRFLQIKNKGWVMKLAYAASILISLLSFSNYIIADVVPKFYVKYFKVPAIGYHIAVLFFFVFFLYPLAKLSAAYMKSSGEKRNQLKYLWWGLIITYVGGTGNFLLSYNINILCLPFLSYLGSLGLLIITYAILRHHLMDINIVIKKTAVYSILVTLITVSYFILIYIAESSFREFIGYKSIFLTLGFLIVFTLLFQPLKNFIQSFADKYFFKGSQATLANELHKAQEELKRTERLKAVGTLAAGMAHEIKNPLTSIKTFTEYLPKKHNDTKFVEKFHKIVSTEVDKINSIVQQLLDFSKPKPLQLQETNIHQTIDQTLSLLSNSFIKHEITLVRNYDSSLPFVRIDINQMQQVFCNLFLNAIEAMKQGGKLTISTTHINGAIQIIISDTGKGIAKKDLEHIFDPFYTTKETGTGLGMSIIYGIVKEHNGGIEVESKEGKGTNFIIELPI